MLNIFSPKQQTVDPNKPTSKTTPAVLRVTKGKRYYEKQDDDMFENTLLFFLWFPDLNELQLPGTCKVIHPDPNNLLDFNLTFTPDEGLYKGGQFKFLFKVPTEYPHSPPKVKCTQKIYHPNIDLEGNVCLNILREDWKPVLTINAVIYGLIFLFVEPNADDPLNKEAAEVLKNNKRTFEQNVAQSMRGGNIGSVSFDRHVMYPHKYATIDSAAGRFIVREILNIKEPIHGDDNTDNESDNIRIPIHIQTGKVNNNRRSHFKKSKRRKKRRVVRDSLSSDIINNEHDDEIDEEIVQQQSSPQITTSRLFKIRQEQNKQEEAQIDDNNANTSNEIFSDGEMLMEDNEEEETETITRYQISMFIVPNGLSSPNTDIENQEPNTYSICFTDEQSNGIIFCPEDIRLSLVGLFSITQLYGPLSMIHGYALQIGQRYDIYNISSQSLMTVKTNTKRQTISNQQRTLIEHVEEILNQFLINYSTDLMFYYDKISLMSNVSIYHVKKLQTTWSATIEENSHLLKSWIFDQQYLSNKKDFYPIWPQCGCYRNNQHNIVCYSDEMLTAAIDIAEISHSRNSYIIFVCGAKDSGKSTYLRYLINSCLSKSASASVAINRLQIGYLDCDIGQSEFTPSGCISYHQITQPLFGPPASHQLKPKYALYFGDITAEKRLKAYLKCVQNCFTQWKNDIKTTTSNVLFVNTMGWASDAGLILLKEMIDTIQPNLIVQVRSESAHYRNTMPEINEQWFSAPESESTEFYRRKLKISLKSNTQPKTDFASILLYTKSKQVSEHYSKSKLSRQTCFWSYFSKLESITTSILKPLVDYPPLIIPFQHIAIGITHKDIDPKYLFHVINASMIALCQVKQDMLYRSADNMPALIAEEANLELIGFGFIRGIDMEKREIHIITPEHSQSNRPRINAIIKGHDDFPDEFYYMGIDRLRGYMPPYVTGTFTQKKTFISGQNWINHRPIDCQMNS
ncbi:unnamed protein product [Didymodactylos carnosus]|uniref:UBC core domain-containing protein n=1 Tax=Didymodactylos carnosus TaxID=1234261 RepID=A0A8S2CN08_9BILA|nr:unnamed protein product [Didymodactylos carnosus]CAF3533639.1 unnamed protein product [Didymodactylos carnosus]